MTSQRHSLIRPGSIVAGSLLGLSAVTPVFAAPFDGLTFDALMQPWDMLLYGSLALLAAGLAARLMRGRNAAKPGVTDDVPDMRWWRGAEPQM